MGITRRLISGKTTFQETIGFTGLRFGTQPTPRKKLLSCGPSSIRLSLSTDGGPTSCRRRSPSDVFFRVPNTSFGIAFKQGILGGEPLSSCMSCGGLGRATMTILVGSKLFFGKAFLRNLIRESRFTTFSMALPFGQFGLNKMIGCSFYEQWHESKMKQFFEMTSLRTSRWLGKG